VSEDFVIRPATRSNVGLFIGLAGGTGSGKTYTAFRIAKGIVGPGKRFGVVDTENKRASHYADEFDFDVID
jgi:dephospho-CoA kinase